MTKGAPLPSCPDCDRPDTLTVYREGLDENAGNRWCECGHCNALVLIDREGRVRRHLKHGERE